jgi:putative transposase
LEAIKGIKTMSELSARYKVHPNVISKWKRQLIEGAPEVFARGSNGSSEEELTGPLYEEIGRLKVENDWLKKKL